MGAESRRQIGPKLIYNLMMSASSRKLFHFENVEIEAIRAVHFTVFVRINSFFSGHAHWNGILKNEQF